MTNSNKHIEDIIIVAIWTIILAWPLGVSYYLYATQDVPFDEKTLQSIYIYLIPFLVLFLIHHYVIMPYIYPLKRIWLSALTFILLLGGFTFFLKLIEPEEVIVIEHLDNKPRGDKRPPHSELGEHKPPMPRGDHRPPHMEHKEHRVHKQTFLLAPPDMARLIIAFLMLGADIGIFAMLQASKQRKRLLQLEQQNLKQELDNLKHQINPHFFMNTLNNIHALIDIDQEMAKRSVIELSQMMRYMLYEGTGNTVSLTREVDYINRYISLMKLRYDEKVEIVNQLDSNHPEIQIPPLLLVTFIENAFKHGVSYREHSFIYINLELIDGGNYLHFSCSNSRHGAGEDDAQGGIGLENVRKRLNLIYGSSYRLEVDTQDCTQYIVNLFLPTQTAKLCPSVV